MRHRVGLATAASVGLALAGSVAALTGTASAATTGCSVSYTVTSQWQGGFQGGIIITNLGDPLSSWSLAFDFPTANQTVTQGWNATWSHSAAHVTAASMSWNGAVATNASVSLGFIGAWSGSNPVPTAFTVNGVTCNGSTTSPSPTPSRSSASPTPSQSSGGGTGAAPALHVSGNHLVTAGGATYRLLGVNRSGAEFACIQGNGMWDGPMDQASITAMKTWKIHAVRIPLNEECWLGTSDVPATGTSGAA
jgi:hypothetical protein